MAAEFVSLADLLRAPALRAGASNAPVPAAPPATIAGDNGVSSESVADDLASGAMVSAVRDARLFRARLADAFDEAAARLLRELACDVLARELRLAPCDLAELVRRACERAPVVRMRVATSDLARVAAVRCSRGGSVQVVEDSALAGGDVVVELAEGVLDARLGVRLAAVLEAFA